MRAKLVLGSMSPVMSSTFSIWRLIRSLTRSNMPSEGHLLSRRHACQYRAHFTPASTRSRLWKIGFEIESKRARLQTHSNSSGADRSATQARVKTCKSRVSKGIEDEVGSTSRRMSSISMAAAVVRSGGRRMVRTKLSAEEERKRRGCKQDSVSIHYLYTLRRCQGNGGRGERSSKGAVVWCEVQLSSCWSSSSLVLG